MAKYVAKVACVFMNRLYRKDEEAFFSPGVKVPEHFLMVGKPDPEPAPEKEPVSDNGKTENPEPEDGKEEDKNGAKAPKTGKAGK